MSCFICSCSEATSGEVAVVDVSKTVPGGEVVDVSELDDDPDCFVVTRRIPETRISWIMWPLLLV